MFWNSVGMTVSILIGQLLVSVAAAWGFARYEFPHKKLLFTLYIVLMYTIPSYNAFNIFSAR